jgi:hypothetical protein
VKPFEQKIVHRVVGVMRRDMAGRTLGFAEKQLLPPHSASVVLPGSSLP